MTTTRRTPRKRARVASRPRRQAATAPAAPQRVLVATDGSDASRAALKLARWMEQSGAWAPEVLTVLQPAPPGTAELVLVPTPEIQQLVTEGLLERITAQVRRHGSRAWKLTVEFGRAAPNIATAARERDVSMIVMGLGRHGRLARIFGAETVARVARQATVPVLAVDPGASGAPKTALVAVDFGASSVNAAREALRLIERPGRLHLLHVRWAFEGSTVRDATWERTYADGVELGFTRLIAELGEQPGVRITSEYRLGGVVETVLAVAKGIGAQVIAAGSHNQTVLDRILIGSTPANLLRAAPCSLLVVPPSVDQA